MAEDTQIRVFEGKQVFSPDRLSGMPLDKALGESANLFAKEGVSEFKDVFEVEGQESDLIDKSVNDFAARVVAIHKKTEFSPEEISVARAQDVGYRTGIVMRMFGEELVRFNDAWKGVSEILDKNSGIEAVNEFKRVFGVSFGKTDSEVQEKIDRYDLWFLNGLDVSKPELVKINLVANEMLGPAKEYADFLGLSDEDLSATFGRTTDIESDDSYIEMLLQKKGGSVPRQKMADFIGRVAHLGWMINQVGRQRYEKDFAKKGYMYGTYRDMVTQSVEREGKDKAWANIAKDFDQYRTAAKHSKKQES